jgi:hypothetical protein
MRFSPVFFALWALGICVPTVALTQASFEERQTTASNVRATLNNLSNFGNAFRGSYSVLGYNSCEYPANSNIEHVFQGGLWIGAQVNGTSIVSTGAVDDASGFTTGKAGYEFTANIGAGLQERSSLLDNQFYNPSAISHQDFVAQFTDRNVIVPGTSIQIQDLENGPLGADVTMEAYNWNYSFADFFVILNFTVRNSSNEIWQNLHIGYWIDPVVRNVAITPAGSGGANFYNKSGTGWIDSLLMGYEFDATGDVGFTESYVGFKFLGAEYNGAFYHPHLDTSFHVLFNSWSFRDFTSAYRTPSNDNERFQRLRSGLNQDPDYETTRAPILRAPGNRSQLLSCGPFVTLMPGEEVNVVFAVVLAPKKADGLPNTADTPTHKQILAQNALWAQQAYNGEDLNFNGLLDAGEDRDGNGRITRYVLPSPPDVPRVRIETDTSTIRVYWTDNSLYSIDPISQQRDFEGFRIYKTQVGFDVQNTQNIVQALQLVAQFDSAGNSVGYNNGFGAIELAQPRRFEGDPNAYRFMYEFRNVLNGWQHAITVTAFDRGDPSINLQPLESSLLSPLRRVFPGTPGNRGFANGDPFVYPNPYYATARWEGSSTSEEDRKILFANLPPRCQVRIYTVAGDLVHTFEHNESYDGTGTRWFETNSELNRNQFSGGEHAWDLLSRDRQIIARGIYLFAVKDLDTGDIRQGKFVVIK